MILAVLLALSPVLFVSIMVTHDLIPWWRQLRDIRGLPETPGRR